MSSARMAAVVALTLPSIGCVAPGAMSGVDRATPTGRNQITILYDAFGKDPGMRKDWGFAALVEVNGKRILFDTGNDPTILAENVRAKGVDLRSLDFVVMSHRHGDHMGGLAYLLSVNPKVKIFAPKEGFGVYGGSLPGTFYRKDDALQPDMRYFDGVPPQLMKFGSAWPGANFELIDKTTEVAPGFWLIALVSDAPGTKELKELSLAIDTPDGTVLVVGCSHPGIEALVEAASDALRRPVDLIVGGLHLVTAPDDVITRVATALHDRWKVGTVAPGHCTGEPTFKALRELFGDRYLYAGVGTVLPLARRSAARVPGGVVGMAPQDSETYRRLRDASDDGREAMAIERAHGTAWP